MMFGECREAQPCVVQLRVQRDQRTAPRSGRPSNFLVSIHEEARVLTWQRGVTVTAEEEQHFVEALRELHTWCLGLGFTAPEAATKAHNIGRGLRDRFLGDEGLAVLGALKPSAMLLEVDETVLNLPWELLHDGNDQLFAIDVPTGRVVTTRSAPAVARDPVTDDAEVTILVVAPEVSDLASVDEEVHAIEGIAGKQGNVRVKVEVLRGDKATTAGLEAALFGRDVEILHVAGHGRFDTHAGAFRLGDGWFDGGQVAELQWAAPPYLVFGSACESARALPGRRLLSRGRASGLPSAFLARGAQAYIGHFWPVGDINAALFARTFYETLFAARNVGQAVYQARRAVSGAFEERSDMTAVGAVFFGDSGTAERADLALAN